MRAGVVTLCGSTKFKQAFELATLAESLAGRIVLSVACFTQADGLHLADKDKCLLDALHLAKISMADEILVINVGGYIGESTSEEIVYARSLGKPVRFWEPQL